MFFAKNMCKNLGENISKNVSSKYKQKLLDHVNNLPQMRLSLVQENQLKNKNIGSNWRFDR